MKCPITPINKLGFQFFTPAATQDKLLSNLHTGMPEIIKIVVMRIAEWKTDLQTGESEVKTKSQNFFFKLYKRKPELCYNLVNVIHIMVKLKLVCLGLLFLRFILFPSQMTEVRTLPGSQIVKIPELTKSSHKKCVWISLWMLKDLIFGRYLEYKNRHYLKITNNCLVNFLNEQK